MNKIIITGHPYAFPYYFKVFDYIKNKKDFIFVLPRLWTAKNGKVRIRLESRLDFTIYGLKTLFYGGHGVGGLFKGWLPGMFFLLLYLRIKYRSKLLYSCSEPYLLTTLCNGLLAKLCGMKYVFFTWQNVEPKTYLSGLKLKIYTSLIKFNLYLADGVICGNKKAELIIKNINDRAATIICPLSGVDTEKFRPGVISDWREKLTVKLNEKLILFYGALDKRKGISILIDALRILNTKYLILNTKLVIVGTGPELENLKLQTTHYQLQNKVIFLDWLPNDQLPALLNSADVFIYPSVPSRGWEEQFGYAMAEASACGVPVVATRTGSIDEVVINGKSGILIEPNNSDQLAEALLRILSDENLAREMGKFGREYITNNFGHPVIAQKITNFLKKVV